MKDLPDIIDALTAVGDDLHMLLMSIPLSIKYQTKLGAITDAKLEIERLAGELEWIAFPPVPDKK